MPRLDKHLLVCVHQREADDPRGSCARRGGGEVFEALRRRVGELGLKRVVRVNAVRCLDQCARGTTVVVYPEATWYGGVQCEDVEELTREHVLRDEPLERLVIADGDLTGRGKRAREVLLVDRPLDHLTPAGLRASDGTES